MHGYLDAILLNMLLIFHVLAAFFSIFAATVLYLKPSRMLLRGVYILTVLMFTSGTMLVLRSPSHLMEACLLGIVMLSVIIFSVFAAREKLINGVS